MGARHLGALPQWSTIWGSWSCSGRWGWNEMHKYSGGGGGGSFSGQGKGNRTRARQEVYTEVNPMNDGQEGRNRVTALSELKVRKWKSDLPATYCSFLLEWSLGWHYVVLSEVAQLCPTLWDPVDCSPPDSSIHGILQARILEWVAISFSRGSSRPRDRTQVSHIAGRHFKL